MCCVATSFEEADAADSAAHLKKTETLQPGEAFVILQFDGEFDWVRFQRFQRGETFRVDIPNYPTLLRVTAGRYYLSKLGSVYENAVIPTFPEPSEPSQTIVVREGAVTYIGDWVISYKTVGVRGGYAIHQRFDEGTILSITRKYDLTGLKLLMALNGDPPYPAEWPVAK
jgi:hypothetical protein